MSLQVENHVEANAFLEGIVQAALQLYDQGKVREAVASFYQDAGKHPQVRSAVYMKDGFDLLFAGAQEGRDSFEKVMRGFRP